MSRTILAARAGAAGDPIPGFATKLYLNELGQTVATGISPWADQSGSGFDFSQATGSLQPASGRTINGKAAPDWDGTDDLLARASAISGLVAAAAYEYAFVVDIDAIDTNSAASYSNDAIIADTGQFWGLHLRNAVGTHSVYFYHWDGADKRAVDTGFTLTGKHLIHGYYDGTTITGQVDNRTPVTALAGSITTRTGTARLGGAAGGVGFLNGAIASGFVKDSNLSAGQRTAFRSFWASKYGVTV